MGDGLDIDLQKVPNAPPPTSPLLWVWEVVRGWGPAILFVLVIRSVLIEPFQIPSGSMVPTLQIGDFIVISKLTYGLRVPFTNTEILPLGEPERGDIVVFSYPPDYNPDPTCFITRAPRVLSGGRIESGPETPCSTDYIKRIVGLPGDRVEVRDDTVYVNGEEQARTPAGKVVYADNTCSNYEMDAYTEQLGSVAHPTLQAGRYQRMASYGPTEVPSGHYFVMGDNRDHSADSRVWGFVPRSYIKGKAMFVWLSFDSCKGRIRALGSLRTERIGSWLR